MTEEDVDVYARLRASADVVRFSSRPEPRTPEESAQEWSDVVAGWQTRKFGAWTICERETGERLGFIYADELDDDYGELRRGDVDLGWTVDPRRWGEGIAPEAALAVVADLRERLPSRRLVAHTRPENRASVRVMEKIGMRFLCDSRARNGDPAVVYVVGDSATSRPPSAS